MGSRGFVFGLMCLAFLFSTLFSIIELKAGDAVPQTAEQFCAMAGDLDHYRERALDSRNLMAFKNGGGLFDGGVCWWHSRFTRSALYLTYYRPDLAKPTEKQAKALVEAIASNKSVVLIPGYENFRDFSAAWQPLIQKKLESMQRVDGFLRQSWIDGLAGKSEVKPEKLKRIMDQVYREVADEGRIVYLKLQIPNIDCHAWLVVDSVKTGDGYILTIVDSNYFGARKILYREGMTGFAYGGGSSVPYVRRDGELRPILTEVLRFCRPEKAMARWTDALLDRRSGLSAGDSLRRLIDFSLESAKAGRFTPLMRDVTVLPEETIATGWHRLFQE